MNSIKEEENIAKYKIIHMEYRNEKKKNNNNNDEWMKLFSKDNLFIYILFIFMMWIGRLQPSSFLKFIHSVKPTSFVNYYNLFINYST